MVLILRERTISSTTPCLARASWKTIFAVSWLFMRPLKRLEKVAECYNLRMKMMSTLLV